MPKSQFNRYSLKHNLLKRVIIRIDFDGLTNLDSLIERFKSHELAMLFGSYRRIMPSAQVYNSGDSNRRPGLMHEIAETTHVFYDYQPAEDKVDVTFTASYVSIQIRCVDYANIDPYRDLMCALIKQILKSDTFIVITKIGIRKIAAYEHENPETLFRVFEQGMFSMSCLEALSEKLEMGHLQTSYEDSLMVKIKYPICVKLKRLVRHLLDPKTAAHALQAILDIDAFVGEEDLRQYNVSGSYNDVVIALDNINIVLFETFKASVTKTYLERHGCVE